MWRASRRLQAKAQKKSRKKGAFSSAARWLLGLCASLYFASLVYAPALSGSFGRAAHQALIRLLGLPAYFIPAFLAAVLFQYFHKDASRMRLSALGSLIALADLCVGFSLFGRWLFADAAAGGGAFGRAVEQALYGSIGGLGTLAVVLA
ncbi:MAG: DNA translocase FtsK 4TM domain-containing protein, partial [Elusimicrobia bacterium]|nr:DNA translocase FtsK 4TM domain-containing protein [Elusimicrobiota bacterium]